MTTWFMTTWFTQANFVVRGRHDNNHKVLGNQITL